jgi:RNA polymerase sigma-70 factor (ECF subfamily)
MPGSSASRFPETSWSLIVAAADPVDSRKALAALCECYWHPVYAFVRRSGYDRDQAQDLTQGFFTLLIEKNYLSVADPQRGRFRSFLLGSVKNFLANEWDRANALKRGGGHQHVAIDPISAEAWYQPAAQTDATPESLFQRRWALSLLERVMSKLKDYYSTAGKSDRFETLAVFLNRASEDPRYDDLADRIGVSPGALRMSVHRMRRKYRELLRAEIADTVSKPEEVEDEIRFLLSALQG